MFALFKKELASFFSSLTGYLVIALFLIVTALFLFILPGEFNIIYGGYATLDSLFYLAPWIYLFLIPAITMRLFAEEKKGGTLELLLTRPLTEFQIVIAKYLSGLALVALSLLPTLIFYLSVWMLGSDSGNIDTGATWGSYIGLFFLGAVYVSIGVFSSSITDNQIVAFVISLIGCFLFYYGFEAMSSLPVFKSWEMAIAYLGIDAHYQSISRGVVDSRDIIYFGSVIFIFLLLTKTVINSRKW